MPVPGVPVRVRASAKQQPRQLDHGHHHVRCHPALAVEHGPVGDADRHTGRPCYFQDQVGQAAGC